MNVIKKELRYFLLTIKKLRVFLLIPVLLSIYAYIIFTAYYDNFVVAFVHDISYDVLKIALPVLWAALYVLAVLYICKLHFGLKIRIKTLVFIVISGFLCFCFTAAIHDIMFQNGLFKYVKILDITIGYFVEFIFLVMFLPLCVFKIRHLIKINIIFARKYFVLIIFLIISYILLEKVLGRMASNLPCMEFIGEYTFVNPAEIIRNFPPFLTIICYKNRRIIKTGIKYAISNLTGGGKDPP